MIESTESYGHKSTESDENFGDFNPYLKTKLLFNERDSIMNWSKL